MGQVTEESGAQSVAECQCAEEFFMCNSTGCLPCPDGLECAAGLKLRANEQSERLVRLGPAHAAAWLLDIWRSTAPEIEDELVGVVLMMASASRSEGMTFSAATV